MKELITNFLKKQTCASICCVDEDSKPWCFSCFYVFNEKEAVLYFKSSASTRHGMMMAKSSFVAGTILPDKLNTLTVRGVQFEGEILNADEAASGDAANWYYKKNPVARAMPGEVWAVRLHTIKMTDSTLGFGKKVYWLREEVTV
jgi:hypothetical protein